MDDRGWKMAKAASAFSPAGWDDVRRKFTQIEKTLKIALQIKRLQQRYQEAEFAAGQRVLPSVLGSFGLNSQNIGCGLKSRIQPYVPSREPDFF
jgi:hypothetical protein